MLSSHLHYHQNTRALIVAITALLVTIKIGDPQHTSLVSISRYTLKCTIASSFLAQIIFIALFSYFYVDIPRKGESMFNPHYKTGKISDLYNITYVP